MRFRFVIGLGLGLLVMVSLSETCLAWNPVAHQYINFVANPSGSDAYVFAGTFPDSAAMSELGDFFHAPQYKAGNAKYSDVPWPDSSNFASVWLEAARLQGLSPGSPVQAGLLDQARGWGGHIVADWVAHSKVPLTHSFLHNLDHLEFEMKTDMLLLLEGGGPGAGYTPPEGFTVPCCPDTVRNVVLSQCVSDWSTLHGDDVALMLKLRQQWYEDGLDDVIDTAAIHDTFVFWMAEEDLIVAAEESLLTQFPSLARDWADDAAEMDAWHLLRLSKDAVSAWLDDPRPYATPYFSEIEPLYPAPLPVEGTALLAASDASGDCHEWLAEVLGVLAKQALESGVLAVVEEPCPEDPAVTFMRVETSDQAELQAFVREGLSAIASPGSGPEVSLGAQRLATYLDRVVNDGISDSNALRDFVAPTILPVTPAPDEIVGLLRPQVAVSFEDPSPSAGIDPASLVVLLDGQALEASLDEGLSSCQIALPSDLSQGYHTLSVTVADKVGQSSTAEWTFGVALHLTWLPPLAVRQTARSNQTVPVTFTLRDDNGCFCADSNVVVRVYDKADPLGPAGTLFRVSRRDGIRIDTEEERYHLNLKLKSLSWVEPGMSLGILVEAGGIKLGEVQMGIR